MVKPDTSSEKLAQAKECKESKLSGFRKSNTNAAKPGYVEDLDDSNAPGFRKSATNGKDTEPKQDTPRRNTKLSSLLWLCNEAEAPGWEDCNASRAKPGHANDRTNDSEPKRLAPKIETGGPKHAHVWHDGGKSECTMSVTDGEETKPTFTVPRTGGVKPNQA